MTRFGKSLQQYLQRFQILSKFSVLSIGLGMLDALEAIHAAGLTHNDLKPENILLGHFDQKIINDSNKNVFKDVKIHLIDFGFADAYMVDQEHILPQEIDVFRGNMVMASID